jgi:hypothetical protein
MAAGLDSELPVGERKLAIGIGLVFVSIAAELIAPGARAQEACSVEVKLLLAAQATQTAVTSVGFKKVGAGRVYFFDTKGLDLFAQGLILRIRQGTTNDFAVKVRLPGDGGSSLRNRFRCEIDRTPAGSSTSYTVGRSFKATKVPDNGDEIYRLLNASQKQLLVSSKAQVDWSAVKRIVGVTSTTWRTEGKFALELWEWPAGKVLELSAKSASAGEEARYVQLEELARANKLPLSDVQDNKTSVALGVGK